MKFFVNENCIGCELCANTCPDVFSMTDAGLATAIKGDVDENLEAPAMEALEDCPVDAIENE